MKMTPRVAKLRDQSRNAVPTLSAERALLLTEFYRATEGKLISVPMRRALAFQYLLEHKTIVINEGELIVGEKGPAPKAAPTYPELCTHTLDDLDILDGREKVPFKVFDEVRKVYQETLIPFWNGKSMREMIFERMTPEWKAAYAAGVFTEFMEQRSPGHTVLDGKIYHKGLLDFKDDIQRSLDGLDYESDLDAPAKAEELKAMAVTADALIRFGERHAEHAQTLANAAVTEKRRAELECIAQVCAHVPAHPPRDFWEALQYYWFVHLGVTTELNPWDAFCPGHLDQHLLPFYERGLDDGTLTPESAEELLQCLWVKFDNQPAPPKVGVTAQESSTYTDFVQINIGGVKADGNDAVNSLSYMILDVIETMRQIQPNPSVQLSQKNPEHFARRVAEVIREGMGKPDIFNSELVVEEMLRVGKSVVDARQGGTSGCVETGAFGKEAYILTGYFNMPKVLEITLYNGLDPRTGEQLGPQTGDPRDFATFEELFAAYEEQLKYFIDVKIEGNNTIERLYAEHLPAPFLSLLTDDCIATGRDYHEGGARYDSSYIQGVGLGTMTDALSALKVHVYAGDGAVSPTIVATPRRGVSTRRDVATSMAELLAALAEDFADRERLRQLLLNRTPKYGNDEDTADEVMVRVFEAYFDAIDGRPNTRGGAYRVNLLPTTCHIYFGSVIGATPDGRRAGTPVSEGVSPVQGADCHGPTAVLRSVAKMDQVRTGGTLLNQKFTPQVLESFSNLEKLVKLIRAYFRMGGHHIQFNVVDVATLRAAQANPEQYRDLIVRVAGYSDYFCDLTEALQEEIISRTEHEGL